MIPCWISGSDMAKSDPKKEPELHPDAWARFKRAVDVVAKSPPQHRVKPSGITPYDIVLVLRPLLT